jgi:hypothetical protein
MSKKPDTITVSLESLQKNPRLKVAELPVTFRDSKGRFCKPSKGVSFEVTPPGARKPLRGEIPKDFRRSVANRKQFIVLVLVEWSRERAKKRQKTERARIKKQIEAKKKKPVSKAETKRRKKLKTRINEALIDEGFEKKPPLFPKLERRFFREDTEEKFVKRSGINHLPRHIDSREGPKEYSGKAFEVLKRHIDFDSSHPVELFSFNAQATTIALREYFTPHAQKFLDEVREDSDNAFILRVKTKNRIENEPATFEGIGTERFKVRDHLSAQELRGYRKRYPGLTNDQILRELQLEDLMSKLKDLFEYFMERYQDYLSKKVISSIAVTGFSMEVVKGVMS